MLTNRLATQKELAEILTFFIDNDLREYMEEGSISQRCIDDTIQEAHSMLRYGNLADLFGGPFWSYFPEMKSAIKDSDWMVGWSQYRECG